MARVAKLSKPIEKIDSQFKTWYPLCSSLRRLKNKMADPKPDNEKISMDIVTGSMYSLNLLRNLTVAIFNPKLNSMSVSEFYEQWLKKCKHPQRLTPYNLGSIMGYLYCGILLAKEQWYELLPDEKIAHSASAWGFSSAAYTSSKKKDPSIKYTIRRMRNALGHGNILFTIPSDLGKDKEDKLEFEKRVTIKFFDKDTKNCTDIFEIEMPLLDLTTMIKKFHSIAYQEVIKK